MLGLSGPTEIDDNTSWIACAHAARFFPLLSLQSTRESSEGVSGHTHLSITQVKFPNGESFVNSIAHYAQERDSRAAVDKTRPNHITWIGHFFLIFKGVSQETQFTTSLHDSMMDCLISRMREQKPKGQEIQRLIRVVFDAADLKNLTTRSRMHFLLAVLYLHHSRETLMPRNRYPGEGYQKLDLFSDIRDEALAILLGLHRRGNFNAMPQYSLGQTFNQYRPYHIQSQADARDRSAKEKI